MIGPAGTPIGIRIMLIMAIATSPEAPTVEKVAKADNAMIKMYSYILKFIP